MLSSLLLISATVRYSADVNINVKSSTLVSINNYNTTSKYLLGLSAYGSSPLSNDTFLKELNGNLGVNVVGYGEQLNGILPRDQAQGIQCCNTTQGLTNYIQSGEACTNYKTTFDPNIWNNPYYKQDTSITTFIYLKDSCQSNYYPEDYHCIGNDSGIKSIVHHYSLSLMYHYIIYKLNSRRYTY